MGLPRSTYYDAPAIKAGEADIVARIKAICDEFETYGHGIQPCSVSCFLQDQRFLRSLRLHVHTPLVSH